jgi:hypothetical protein
MQLDSELSGVQEIVESGIIAAQLHVERVIDGKLGRQSHDARYFIDAEAFSGMAPGGLYRLEVPSGLVRQDTTPVVTFSNELSPFSTHTAINSDLSRFDYNRGYLLVDASTYRNSYVRVQADTGFEDGTRALPTTGLDAWAALTQYAVGDKVAYQGVSYEAINIPPVGTVPTDPTYWKAAFVPMETIPDAIYEAIISLVPMVFNAQQTTNRNDEAQKQYRVLTDHANLLLQPYVRTQGFTFRPI